MNDIRVLLVESELSDARFLEDALAEIEEMTHGGSWVHWVVTHLELLEDAVTILTNERPDIVLFSPNLPDSAGFATFTALRDAAPDVALIAMIEASEEALGRRMLRQGGQDFIVKSEVDCRPFARAILNAIERQRFQRCAQLASAVDFETGFYTAESFHGMAARDLELAGNCSRPITLVIAELDDLIEAGEACGRETVHELIVEAANVIRASAGATALIGRLALGRFAIISWQHSPDRLVTILQNAVQEGHHPLAFIFGCVTAHPGSGTTVEHLMQAADAALYENKQAYSNLN